MPTARGFINCENDRLVGTFDFEGDLYHLSVDIRPSNQSFNCSNATLTYASAEELLGPCAWTGRASKTDIHMKLGEGVSVAARLDKPRVSPVLVRGAGVWTADKEISLDQPASPDGQLARERLLLASGVPIIAVLGQPGTGKSTFINLIASDQQKVNNGLRPCTYETSIIEANVCGKRIVLIDTPGIDDFGPGATESAALANIASRFESMGRDNVWVTGILFMNRINDTKFTQTAGRVASVVKKLCGESAMNHVTICTTMWDKIMEELGYERLEELCQLGAWKEMVDMGAGTAQISSVGPDAKNGAEIIVSELIDNSQPVELAIQDEMINQNKTVAQTAAGMVLSQHLRLGRAEADRELKYMRAIMRKEIEDGAAKVQEAIRAQELAVKELEQAKERFRDQQALYVRLQQEKEEAEHEKSVAETAKMEATIRTREVEVEEFRRQMDALVHQAQWYKEQREREPMVREFALLITQGRIPNGTTFHILNKRFKTVLELDGSRIKSAVLRGGQSQQWEFEHVDGGYAIVHVTRSGSCYLAPTLSSGGMVVSLHSKGDWITWKLQSTDDNTYRIISTKYLTRCLELSAPRVENQEILKPYNADATEQLWEFVPVGAK